MIDRYFELAQAPIDPVRIWQWVGNLNFHRQCQSDQNKSVQVIRENYTLRQGIIAHVFGLLTDRKEIFNIKVEKFDGHPHSHMGQIQQYIELEFGDEKLVRTALRNCLDFITPVVVPTLPRTSGSAMRI
ncbi:hypothetical protein M5G07_07420 [Serratia symbiotica]|nr:hypothetical protein [Serratia symbiotica]